MRKKVMPVPEICIFCSNKEKCQVCQVFVSIHIELHFPPLSQKKIRYFYQYIYTKGEQTEQSMRLGAWYQQANLKFKFVFIIHIYTIYVIKSLSYFGGEMNHRYLLIKEIYPVHGGTYLLSQHLGGRSRKTRSV